ncbi:MAG: ribosome maturation factor RimP [Ruminiclostridium sp.]|nr:ribosome maturation factor RimP [Ruminiclostridium sp.]
MCGVTAKKEAAYTAKKDNSVEERARAAVMPVIEKNGLSLWDVCFEKEGAMWYLRVLVDKEGGLDSDECELISKPINEILDKQELIKSVDILEVGSPGLTKKLRRPEHFRACIGEPVRVTRRGDKGKEYSVYGILAAYDEERGTITLEDKNEKTELVISECVKINSDL